MKIILQILIALFFFTSEVEAKQMPKWTSQSIFQFKSTQLEYKTDWLRLQKFEDHTLIFEFKDEKIKSFKINAKPELQLGQWYRDNSTQAPMRRQLKDIPYSLAEDLLILEITDYRAFKVFEDELKNKSMKTFQLNIEVIDDKDVKKIISIQLRSIHGQATTPYQDSYLNKWYARKIK